VDLAADFLTWLEGSALGRFMRESSFWTYPLTNTLHVLGVAVLFGSILVLDLRLLGLWRTIPLASLGEPARRVSQVGFALAAVSGAGLLATQASEYLGNPWLALKFPAIGLGLVNVAVVTRSTAWRAPGVRPLTASEERRLAVSGATSLLCWLTALVAGRLVAYH
jgi:uncharacterized membrane protein